MRSLKGILKSNRDIWTDHKIPNNLRNEDIVFQNPVTPIPGSSRAHPTEVQTAESVPSGPNPSCMVLPVELWREIFLLGTSILGKDEFSTDGSGYVATQISAGPRNHPPTEKKVFNVLILNNMNGRVK